MKVIDLTKSLYNDMEIFPGDPDVEIKVMHTHEESSWELRELKMGSHSGTHVDAFSHMHKELETLDEIPIERFFGKSIVVEAKQKFPEEVGLFFKEKIGMEIFSKIILAKPAFVGGKISEDLERNLLAKKIITFTDLVNLESIPKDTYFTFFGFPLKIKSGDGSPIRAVAIIEE